MPDVGAAHVERVDQVAECHGGHAFLAELVAGPVRVAGDDGATGPPGAIGGLVAGRITEGRQPLLDEVAVAGADEPVQHPALLGLQRYRAQEGIGEVAVVRLRLPPVAQRVGDVLVDGAGQEAIQLIHQELAHLEVPPVPGEAVLHVGQLAVAQAQAVGRRTGQHLRPHVPLHLPERHRPSTGGRAEDEAVQFHRCPAERGQRQAVRPRCDGAQRHLHQAEVVGDRQADLLLHQPLQAQPGRSRPRQAVADEESGVGQLGRRGEDVGQPIARVGAEAAAHAAAADEPAIAHLAPEHAVGH